MGTLTRKVEIKIDGKDYKAYNFSNITLSQELLNPNELSFTMQKKKLEQGSEDSDFHVPKELIGAKVELTINAMRFDENEEKESKFKGIIFNINVRRSSDMLVEQLIDVTACTPDYLLIDHAHCYSYEEMSLKDIVTKTLDPYQIPNDINPRTTQAIPYTVQYNESNYQFLNRLALRYGEWMYNDGTKWIFGKIKKKDKVQLDPRHDIIDYRYQAGLTHHKLKHAHHDYLEYENLIKSDSDFPDLTQSGYHELTDEVMNKSKELFTKNTFQHLQCSNPEDNDIDELEVSAKAQLFGKKAVQVVCTGTTLRADLTIGSVIEIQDYFFDTEKDKDDKDHDDLIITSIVHTTEVDGHYSNTFTAVPASSEYPPYYQSDIFPVSSAQRAVVKENDDPEKLGRIRVQFLWQEEQDPKLVTPWIRIAQPHGGDDKGFYFIPEIDEEVMVDFENGNAEKPYVVGTLFHGEHLPGYKWPTGSNDIKAIRTRNGHTIEIHDKGKNGYIRIYDHEKENYILTFSTDQKLIKLESTGNIELYAKNDIILNAGHDIKQRADNTRDSYIQYGDTLTGETVTIKASSDIKVNAGGDITVNADGNILQEAMGDNTVRANGNVNLNANADINAQAGGSMSLQASGTNTIKGSVVNIN